MKRIEFIKKKLCYVIENCYILGEFDYNDSLLNSENVKKGVVLPVEVDKRKLVMT